MGRFAFLRTLALLDCRDPNVMSLFLVSRAGHRAAGSLEFWPGEALLGGGEKAHRLWEESMRQGDLVQSAHRAG